MTLTSSQIDALDRDGFLALPGLVPRDKAEQWGERLLAVAKEQPDQGSTLHLNDVFAVLPEMVDYVRHPLVLAAMTHILGPKAQNVSAHFRTPLPGYGQQAMHADWSEPKPKGDFLVANAIIALCNFTESNGATRVVPGSHRYLWHSGVKNESSAPCPAVLALFQNEAGRFYQAQ